jgi:hypothetical protein
MKTKNDAIFRDAQPTDPVATAGNLSVFIRPELRTLQPAIFVGPRSSLVNRCYRLCRLY